jgi:leucyl aminopeptidase
MADTNEHSGIEAVFFDLGDTLVTATVSGQPPRLISFDVFPFIPGVLADLQAKDLRLGVILNTGDDKASVMNAILQPTELLTWLDPTLLVYSADEGVTKASPEIFNRAAARMGYLASQCLFVGEDATERAVAASTGWAVCPHPLLVGEVLAGQPLQFVRLTVPAAYMKTPWQEQLQQRAFVPQHLTGSGGTIVYGLTSQRIALELTNMQFGVELLGPPDLPQLTDLFLLRDDLARQTGFLTPVGDAAQVFSSTEAKQLVLSSTTDGVVVAVPPDVDFGVDAFHFDNARHGHTLKLIPDPLLWNIPPPASELAATALVPLTLPPEVIDALAQIDAILVMRTVEMYSGQRALDGAEGGARVKSRHILEKGNARAVNQLVTDLNIAGQGRLQVRRHPFSHAGRMLQNIEAELAGESPELVLVTAHLDSTAGSEPRYNPRNDPAPGADDDASGVA